MPVEYAQVNSFRLAFFYLDRIKAVLKPRGHLCRAYTHLLVTAQPKPAGFADHQSELQRATHLCCPAPHTPLWLPRSAAQNQPEASEGGGVLRYSA